MKTSVYASGAAALLTLLSGACNRTPEFKVSGNIKGADGQTILLERPGFHGEWLPVDSTRTASSGAFSIKAPRPASPEIYRLRIADCYVYFPIDSTESIGVESSLAEFGHAYTLSGSDQARRLSDFEKEFARYASDPASAGSTAEFKRKVYTKYLQPAPGSIVSYHILTKTMADGKPFYDISGADDYRYLAAVANGFKSVRPDDPHGNMLEAYALQAIKVKNREKGIHTELSAQQIDFPAISLPDENGKNRSLADVTGQGVPVILVFAPLTDPEAAARNRELYDRHSKGGVRIFQVSFDQDQYLWREAAANLPWITVNDPSGRPASAIDYNITSMPVYYLIDAQGNLTKRADSINQL